MTAVTGPTGVRVESHAVMEKTPTRDQQRGADIADHEGFSSICRVDPCREVLSLPLAGRHEDDRVQTGGGETSRVLRRWRHRGRILREWWCRGMVGRIEAGTGTTMATGSRAR